MLKTGEIKNAFHSIIGSKQYIYLKKKRKRASMQRRLFFCIPSQGTKGMYQFYLTGKSFQISLPALWTITSLKYFQKTFEDTNRITEHDKHTFNHILARF